MTSHGNKLQEQDGATVAVVSILTLYQPLNTLQDRLRESRYCAETVATTSLVTQKNFRWERWRNTDNPKFRF